MSVDEKIISSEWFVHPNDLIGGWSVMAVDCRPSVGGPEAAECVHKGVADHIANVHNADLFARQGNVDAQWEGRL